MVKGGFGWCIGNGEGEWFNIWLGADLLCMFVDEIKQEEVIKEEILSIDLTGRLNKCNKPIWKGNVTGIIIAKPFFNFISSMEDEESNENRDWKWVWKVGIHQKIKFSLWLIAHERLPIAKYLCHLGIVDIVGVGFMRNPYACHLLTETVILPRKFGRI
ncbi:hypothetical protein LguiA_031590 [Lonicera macranthoides]